MKFSFDTDIPELPQDDNEDFSPPQNESEKLSDLEKRNGETDLKLKKRFAKFVLRTTKNWLIFISLLIAATGICRAFRREAISDAVLIALISGTSLSAITGLVVTPLRYLFSRKKD